MKRNLLPLLLVLGLLFLFVPYLSISQRKDAKILFVGDIFLDRYIRQVGEKRGGDYLFECIDNLLHDADIVVANLEGPITDFQSRSVGTEPGSSDNFVFTFSASSARLLSHHNIKIVNLGNNHINNFGPAGVEQTKKYLEDAGVNYFGGPTGDEPVFRIKINNQKTTFISYNQFGGDNADKIVEKIKREKTEYPKNKIIIYAHWGEEYIETTWQMRSIAQSFAKAGADTIIGSHPHVVQANEMIGDTPVYYSLGNFIFDQYWDKSVRTGLALELTFSNSGITAKEFSLDIKSTGQTCSR